MTVLACGFTIEDLNNSILEYCTTKKSVDEASAERSGVFYTDGGSRKQGETNYGGWGIHGYLYTDKDTNTNSGCDKAKPTRKAYVKGNLAKNEHKAFVVSYIDYYGPMGDDSTVNRAELTAMLRCLSLIDKLNLKRAYIYADSKLVLNLLKGANKYKSNGFMGSKGEPLANQELCRCVVEQYDEVILKTKVILDWVKGHSGDFGNDMADNCATRGCMVSLNTLNNLDVSQMVDLDETVEDLKHASDTAVLKVGHPDSYFGKAISAPVMLGENQLYFSTNQWVGSEHNTYYQATSGKANTGSGEKKKDPKRLRGKPMPDDSLSVVRLNEPCMVLNNLINMVSHGFKQTGLIEANLSTIMRASTYTALEQGAIEAVQLDSVEGKIKLPMIGVAKAVEIATLLNPVRKAVTLARNYAPLTMLLREVEAHHNDEASGFTHIKHVMDITSYLYDVSDTGKKVKVTTKDYTKGYVDVPVDFTSDERHVKSTVRVNLYIDTPPALVLGRFKTINPVVKLFVWELGPYTFRYGIFIKTDEGVGVWVGINSNIHLY